jgi:hypothetical protein
MCRKGAGSALRYGPMPKSVNFDRVRDTAAVEALFAVLP